MPCPSQVAAVLLDLLGHGILVCRAAGWAGNAENCALEADHLHNLPGLLADFSPERLRYYWEAERTSFAARCDADALRQWEELWDRLRPLVEAAAELNTVRS